MIPIDEKHMIRLAADGDMAAFEQLVTTHQPAIYRLALRMTGNPEDAADMTQEAFLRAWRGLGSFQADSSLSTWLFRLTSNVCIDFLRAARRHLVVPISGLDADGEEYTLDAPDPAKLPEEELLAREEREELRAGEYKVTWKPVTSSRLDAAALRKALPEVAACFTRTSTARRFCVA